MLSVIDGLWKEHLLEMDHLKEGIGLRGYAQQDPLVAYKKESFDMFEAMMAKFQEDTSASCSACRFSGRTGSLSEAPRRSRAAPCRRAARGQRRAALASTATRAPREIAIPTRQPSTTIDELEKEFHRKKQRELAVATRAGGGEASAAQPAPHRRKSGPQRSLPLRLRQEIQKMPRRRSLAMTGRIAPPTLSHPNAKRKDLP